MERKAGRAKLNLDHRGKDYEAPPGAYGLISYENKKCPLGLCICLSIRLFQTWNQLHIFVGIKPCR